MPISGESRSVSASGLTSASMLGRARERDPEAWRWLVQLYSPLVFHWCRQSGLDSHDAADVMQETFQSVHGALDRFQRERAGAFRGWLWTITRNKIRDYGRAKQRSPAAAGGSSAYERWQELPDAEPEPSDHSVSGERKNSLLHRALELIRADFNESTWTAFQGVVVEQRPAAEVAAELKLSVGAVYQARARVLQRLREEMGELIE